MTSFTVSWRSGCARTSTAVRPLAASWQTGASGQACPCQHVRCCPDLAQKALRVRAASHWHRHEAGGDARS